MLPDPTGFPFRSCHANCQTCTSSAASSCLSCHITGTRPNFKTSTSTCEEPCTSGNYWDGSTCATCPADVDSIDAEYILEAVRGCRKYPADN